MVSLAPWAVAVVVRLRRLKCRPVVLTWPQSVPGSCTGVWEDGDSGPISELASSLAPTRVADMVADLRRREWLVPWRTTRTSVLGVLLTFDLRSDETTR